jgi:hypothetical protein
MKFKNLTNDQWEIFNGILIFIAFILGIFLFNIYVSISIGEWLIKHFPPPTPMQ